MSKKSILKKACGRGGPTSTRISSNLVRPITQTRSVSPIINPGARPIPTISPKIQTPISSGKLTQPKPTLNPELPVSPKTQINPINQPRPWGVALPGHMYPAVEGPGNPSWERRNPRGGIVKRSVGKQIKI